MRLVLLTLALAGCSSPQYYKPGATQEEFARAKAGCQVQAAMVPAMDDQLFRSAIVGQTVTNCLRAQGFIRRD